MGKIMVLTVPENEERIFEWIEQYLIVNKEFTITNSEQNILLTFPGLEIDIQNREIWIESGKVILTDLEFRILLLKDQNKYFLTSRFTKEYGMSHMQVIMSE